MPAAESCRDRVFAVITITDRPPDARIPSPPLDRVTGIMERLLETADVSRVYGEPILHGGVMILPAAEVLAIAGFGMGSGGGIAVHQEGQKSRGSGGGGGGGGKTLATTVAVIVASPDGVEVRPVIDFTKIALAALTAAGFVVAAWKRDEAAQGLLRRLIQVSVPGLTPSQVASAMKTDGKPGDAASNATAQLGIQNLFSRISLVLAVFSRSRRSSRLSLATGSFFSNREGSGQGPGRPFSIAASPGRAPDPSTPYLGEPK
jgi:uncharacterized spore protein YtfJ